MIKLTYLETNDQECRGEILNLLTVLTRAGLDCTLIDSQNLSLLKYVLSQYDRSDKNYFPNTSVDNLRGLLRYAQEMFITRNMLGDLWISGVLVDVIELPHYKAPGLSWKIVFKALTGAVPMVFNAARTDFLLYYIERIMKIAIRLLKSNPMYPPAISFIIRILLFSREFKMNWESFSLFSLERALDFINNPRLKNYKDFWRLCSLWGALSPNSFIEKEWLSFICSGSAAREKPVSLEGLEFSRGMRLDSVLKSLGLLWVPGFVVAVRFGADNMYETILMDYVKKFGEEKFLENIVLSISFLVERTSRFSHIKDLTCCIITAISSSASLLKKIRTFSTKDIKSDFLYKECVKFCNFIQKSTIPDSMIRTLCSYMRVIFSLVGDYNILTKFFDTIDENKNHDKVLLEELCFYISKCPKEKLPTMSYNTIETITSSGSKNILRAANGLFAPQNIATTYKVADSLAHKEATYENIEVYCTIISLLPKNLNAFEFIVKNIECGNSGLFRTKLENILLKILRRITLHTEKEKLMGLAETIMTNTSASTFIKLKAALQEAIGNSTNESESLLSSVPEGTKMPMTTAYDKNKLESYILKEIKLRMNNNIEIVSSLFEFKPTYFREVLFAGELDHIITSFVKSRGDEIINDMVCSYAVKILNDLENADNDPKSWEKSILACSLIDALDKDILMHVTYDQLTKFSADTIHNFVHRWKESKEKSIYPPATLYDFYIIMRVIILALFDYNRVTLDNPDIVRLVSGIYDAYHHVVLPQNLQAASTITKCLSQGPDERSIAEGKLHAFLAAQITGGFSDLEIFGKSFVKTLVSLEFTLARKFTGIFFPLQPVSSSSSSEGKANTKRMGRIQDLAIYRMCQLHESPELTLRVALNFIMTAGVSSARDFYWVFNGLCSMISSSGHGLISDELKCLALRGATSLLVNVCIHDTREERIGHILDPEIYSNKQGYGLHRAKMINESIPLEEIISMSHEEYVEVLSVPENTGSRSSSLSPMSSPLLLSPKDEATVVLNLRRQGATNLSELIESFFNFEYERETESEFKFGYDPLPLSELSKKRTFHWKGLNISVAITNFMCTIENILDLQDLILKNDDLRLSNLQCEAIRSIVTLSDVLVPAQSMWLFDICIQLFDLVSESTVDFVLMHNLTIGVLKAAAQTNTKNAHIIDSINRVICHSLLSEHIIVKNAALIGVRFLMQASNRDAFLPPYLVSIIMNHINEIIYAAEPESTDDYVVQPESTTLYALSAGFDIIQNFPRTSEEFGFTDSFISCATSLCVDPKCSSGVIKNIHKGFRLLLLCDTIDQDKRIFIENFALEALQQNTIHSNLSMGLLFTAMFARKDAFSLYASKRRGPKSDELKKFQAIFEYIKRQSDNGGDSQISSPKLVDILGQMMADLLTPERGLEFVLRELVGSTKGYRRIVARVMDKILSVVGDKDSVFDIINAGISNFDRGSSGVLLTTCVLLSVSSNDVLLHSLFDSVLYGKCNKELLMLAGKEALRRFSSKYGEKLKITLKYSYNIDL